MDVPKAYEQAITNVDVVAKTITFPTEPPSLPNFGKRFVWFIDGVGIEQVRKVESKSGNTYTLDDIPTGVAVGDNARVNITLEELSSVATATVESSQEIIYIFNEDVRMGQGCFLALHGQTMHIRGNNNEIRPIGSTDGMLQLGYRDVNGVYEGASTFNMQMNNNNSSTVTLSYNPGSGSSGFRARYYGSNVGWSNGIFAYYLAFDNDQHSSRIEGCKFNISGGFRIGVSEKSTLVDNIFIPQFIGSNVFPFTLRGNVTVSGNVVKGGRQGLYWSSSGTVGGNASLRGHSATDVQFDIRALTSAQDKTLTLIDDFLRSPLVIDGGFSDNNTKIERLSTINVKTFELSGLPIEGVKVRNDNIDDATFRIEITDINGKATEILTNRAIVDFQGENNFFNNRVRVYKYGYVFSEKSWQSNVPYVSSEFIAVDESIRYTETEAQGLLSTITIDVNNKTIDAAGRTSFETYAALSVWHYDVNDLKSNRFFSMDSNTLVLVDGWQVSDIDGLISDINGDSSVFFEQIDSWSRHPNASDMDSNSNQAANGLGSEIDRFDFSGTETFYYRLVSGGVTSFQEVVIDGPGETKVSLDPFNLIQSRNNVGYNEADRNNLNLLAALVNGNKFTATALENAPTGSGGGTAYDDSILQGKVDGIRTVVDSLENYDDSSLQTKVDAIPTTDSVADLNPVISAISSLNDFDPANDTVEARNMRGTDGANTVAPDNTGISNANTKLDNIPTVDNIADVSGIETKVQADERQSALISEIQANNGNGGISVSDIEASSVLAKKSDIDALNDFDPNTEEVTAGNFVTPPTTSEITTALLDVAGQFKADTVTVSNIQAIATAVEESILDENDGTTVLNAIVGAIGNANVNEIALVAAIRADLERNGGKLNLLDNIDEADMHTWLDTYDNKKSYQAKATVAL